MHAEDSCRSTFVITNSKLLLVIIMSRGGGNLREPI
jgi:hypothetical protein